MKESTRAAIMSELKAAGAIADTAQKAGRDFTEAERKKAQAHLDMAKTLKERAAAAADFGGQLQEISDVCGLGDDSSSGYGNSYTPPGSKSNAGAAKAWGAAVVAANSDSHRYKGITAAGSVVVGVPAPSVVEMGRPVPTMRSLIPSEQTAGRFSYHRQTVRTNLAAPVAAGDRKPTSIFNTQLVEDRVRVIAHLSEPQSRMDFADAPALQSFVADEMFYGLERALENQLINGNGVGENLTGLAFTSGIQSQPFVSNLVTTTRKAVTALETLGFSGSGFVMSPQDWEALELSATSTGSLLVTEAGQRAPIEISARRLWGRPVVASPACPIGTAYYADFSSTKLYVREEARLDWSEHVYRPDQFGEGIGGSLFEANELLFRAEGRWGFAVMRPAAAVQIDMAA